MELSVFLIEREKVMPLYFFHLSFGDRTVPDDEGVQLPNRSAAHKEALAVIRDLADPEVAGNPRRWASWFLEVADEGGQFLRVPLGHPALEVVTADTQAHHAEEPELKQIRRAVPVSAPRDARGRAANVAREISARRQRTAQLLKDNHQLRQELSSLCLASESTRTRTSRLVLLARLAGSPADDSEASRTATKPARRGPHLVLVPGG
jgi:hypothetical protein